MRAAQPGAVGELPSLRTEYFEFLDTKTSLLLMIGIGGIIGFVGMAWAVGFLGVAARGREAPMRKVILYVPIVGGVVVGISVLMAQIGTLGLTDDFLDGPRTVAAAVNAENDFLLWSSALFQLGSLTLAVGLVLVSLNAMRVGMLTRLMGYIGIVAGAMLILFPLPVVQIFWMGALAVLFFGRWPGGDPPAWRTGKAEPWQPRVAPAPRTAPAGARDPQHQCAASERSVTREDNAMATEGQTLEQQLEELLDQETFSPPEDFKEQAVVSDPEIYEQAESYEDFWAERAEALHWDTKWDQVLDWSNPPFAKWFVGGKLNVSYNCVDRHVEAGNGDRVAYHWRGEEGEELDVTYADLHRDVQKLANGLKDLGVSKGDVVAIYLPMIPEVAVAMLACARIGAIHNVVFGGFSAESVKERIEFSEAKTLITVDGARRKGKTAPIKEQVDEVIGDLVDTIVVVQRVDNDAPMKDGRDH